MTDKTDEQVAKEKASVDAMRNARSNMATVLDRVAGLENALRAAAVELDNAAKHMPNAYGYESPKSLKEHYSEQAEKARKAIG